MPEPSAVGRPRDLDLDAAILEAAREVLIAVGFDGLSLAAVADRAGTTRPAIYRRFRDKVELVSAAIASVSEATAPQPTGDHLADLTAELAAFQRGISTISGLALTATVLSEATDGEVKRVYRERVVAPRRARLRAILDAAAKQGSISADPAARRILVSMCTGSWYAHAVAGDTPPRTWAKQTATLIWRAAGGEAGEPADGRSVDGLR